MAQTKTGEILARLERIEKKIDQRRQSVASIGFGLMIASVSIVMQNIWLGWGTLLGGLVLILLAINVKKPWQK